MELPESSLPYGIRQCCQIGLTTGGPLRGLSYSSRPESMRTEWKVQARSEAPMMRNDASRRPATSSRSSLKDDSSITYRMRRRTRIWIVYLDASITVSLLLLALLSMKAWLSGLIGTSLVGTWCYYFLAVQHRRLRISKFAIWIGPSLRNRRVTLRCLASAELARSDWLGRRQFAFTDEQGGRLHFSPDIWDLDEQFGEAVITWAAARGVSLSSKTRRVLASISSTPPRRPAPCGTGQR